MVWVCEIKLSKNTAFLSKNTAFFVQKHCHFLSKTLFSFIQNTFIPSGFFLVGQHLHIYSSSVPRGLIPSPLQGCHWGIKLIFWVTQGITKHGGSPPLYLQLAWLKSIPFFDNFPSSKWLVNANVCVQENELFEQYFIDKYKGGQPTLQDDRLIYHLRPNSI